MEFPVGFEVEGLGELTLLDLVFKEGLVLDDCLEGELEFFVLTLFELE